VSDPDQVGAWVESGANLEWLCEKHHRGAGGIHHAAFADFEAEKYVRELISKQDDKVDGGQTALSSEEGN